VGHPRLDPEALPRPPRPCCAAPCGPFPGRVRRGMGVPSVRHVGLRTRAIAATAPGRSPPDPGHSPRIPCGRPSCVPPCRICPLLHPHVDPVRPANTGVPACDGVCRGGWRGAPSPRHTPRRPSPASAARRQPALTGAGDVAPTVYPRSCLVVSRPPTLGTRCPASPIALPLTRIPCRPVHPAARCHIHGVPVASSVQRVHPMTAHWPGDY
jgi:hypothetical protein